MCAIVDVNTSHQVFGKDRPEAGIWFADWVKRGNKVVVGGKLLRELIKDANFKRWFGEATKTGRTARVNDDDVDARATKLEQERGCESNDHHIIALAQLSKAKLLFTNDARLQSDFKRLNGKIYSTRNTERVTRGHKNLLVQNHCTKECV